MSKNKGRPPAGKAPGLGAKPRPKKKSDAPAYVRDEGPRLNAPRQRVQQQPKIDMRLGEFVIDRLSHDGRGVASFQGKTLFIEGALTGERVSARLVAEHPRFIEARVDQLLEASPERQTPPCPHVAQCGGCQLQHMSPAYQLQMKQTALLDQMERWAGLLPQRVLPPIRSPATGYRARARLGVWYEADGSVTLGFRQKASKALTPIDSCLVLQPELDTWLPSLRQWLAGLTAAKAVTHIELLGSDQGPAAIIRHTRPLAEADLTGLGILAEKGLYLWLDPGDGLRDLVGNEVDPQLSYSLDGLGQLAFHPQDFTQVNPLVNRAMVRQALDLLALAPADRVVDFFCGMGNFTLPMARLCRQVTGVEGGELMVARGRANGARLGIDNVKFIKADLGAMTHTQVGKLCDRADAILLDPPRDGAKSLVEQLAQLRLQGQLSATRIVYVSCNPATLARDAKILAESGYRLDALGVMDMFPHTSHLESMALFVL